MVILFGSVLVGILSAVVFWLYTGHMCANNNQSVWHDLFLRLGAGFVVFAYGALIFGGDQLRNVLANLTR